jgi:hypothetical protein
MEISIDQLITYQQARCTIIAPDIQIQFEREILHILKTLNEHLGPNKPGTGTLLYIDSEQWKKYMDFTFITDSY